MVGTGNTSTTYYSTHPAPSRPHKANGERSRLRRPQSPPSIANIATSIAHNPKTDGSLLRNSSFQNSENASFLTDFHNKRCKRCPRMRRTACIVMRHTCGRPLYILLLTHNHLPPPPTCTQWPLRPRTNAQARI